MVLYGGGGGGGVGDGGGGGGVGGGGGGGGGGGVGGVGDGGGGGGGGGVGDGGGGGGVGGGGGGGGVGGLCGGWASLCPTIPKNVGKISRLAELQLCLFPLHPPNKKKRLKIVLNSYFSCQFSIGCCTGHFEVEFPA